MPPVPARALLSAIGISALVAGVITSLPIFFVVALGAGVLLGTSLSTSRRPLTRALEGFRNQVVYVRLWGAPPPSDSGVTLVLSSVNVLGAGVHVFCHSSGGGSVHLKVAQPKEPTVASNCVLIRSAKYVQWNGTRLPRVANAPAVTIALSEPSGAGRPESAA